MNTDDMRQQAQKIQVVLKMGDAAYDEAKLTALIDTHRDLIDFNFLTLVTTTIQQAASTHDEPTVDRYGQVRETIIKQLNLKADQVPSLGVEDNIDGLIDQLLATPALNMQGTVAANRPLLDYNFFLHLTHRAERAADPDEQATLFRLRDDLVRITEDMDRRAQEAMQRAVGQLNDLLNAENVEAKLQELAPHLDEAFLVVLSTNVEQARAHQRDDVVEALMRIYARVVTMMEDRLRPEFRALNALLRMDSREERLARLEQELQIYHPGGFIQMLEAVVSDLEEAGQEQPALMERLTQLIDEAREVAANLPASPPATPNIFNP